MATLLTDSSNFPEVGPAVDRRQGSDRRREIRMTSKYSPATLCVAARPPVDVQIRDVSRSGLGIIAPSPILVGSCVVVVCGGLIINGTVRHCKERLSGEYAAGICITRIVDTGAGKEI
jgi:hypothetical protein